MQVDLEELLKKIESGGLNKELFLVETPALTFGELRSKGVFYKIGCPSVMALADGGFSDPEPARNLSRQEKEKISRDLVADFGCLRSLYEVTPKHVARPYAIVVDSNGYCIGYLTARVDGHDLNYFISKSSDKLMAASLKADKSEYNRIKSNLVERVDQIKEQLEEIIEALSTNNLAHADLYGNVMLDENLNVMLVDPKTGNLSLDFRKEKDALGEAYIFSDLDDMLKTGESEA